MKMHKGWLIITSQGDEIPVYGRMSAGTRRWAIRNGYTIKRVFILA